jgi:phosphoglycerate dehydrogenase-like enzyme
MIATSAIICDSEFDACWPFAADHFHELWRRQGPVQFVRLAPDERRGPLELLQSPQQVRRLALFTRRKIDWSRLQSLEETAIDAGHEDAGPILHPRGVEVYWQQSEGFWGQSVAEFALALTLCALRRIPQTYRAMITGHECWEYSPPAGIGRPGERGVQFGDDARFAHGTLAGKRVRIVGMGNIGSRFASFAHGLGADVAAWDPVAAEPSFHRSHARQVHRLEELVHDADVFAPMMPLVEKTRGLVTAELIRALPAGCLVVLVTRAGIVDMAEVRRRVLADELSLAADVFDVEPLPLDDPLLGRHNVVHTAHNAGRTRDANCAWAQALAARFRRKLQRE